MGVGGWGLEIQIRGEKEGMEERERKGGKERGEETLRIRSGGERQREKEREKGGGRREKEREREREREREKERCMVERFIHDHLMYLSDAQ